MRRLALAIALACVLSGAVSAGEIHSTGVVAPTPTPSTVMAPGEIPSTGGASTSSTTTAGGEIPATAPEESGTLLTIILTLISIVY